VPSNVSQRGPSSWCARTTVRGENVYLGSFPTEEQARAAVAAAKSGRLPSQETVEGWFRRWPSIASARRARSVGTVKQTAALAEPFVSRFGRERLGALRRDELVPWAVGRPTAMRYARTILSDAVWAGLIDSNPLLGIRSRTAELRVTPPTLAEVDRLVAAAPAPLDRMILIAAYSGLRLSELAALEVRDVSDDLPPRLHVRCGKGGHERRSLLFAPGLRGLDQMPESGLLFNRGYGRGAYDRKVVNRLWLPLRERAGVPACRFHDLRHFHATWLLDRGASVLDVAIQLGHRDHGDLVRRRYGHPSRDLALDRLAAMAS
jgi:integrase